MKTKVIVLAVVALALVGGAAFAFMRFRAPAEDVALALVPKDSVLYANLFIRPSNSQKMALDDLLQKFPGIDGTDDGIDRLIELLDEELGREGLSFEEDIEPWLGDQVAGFVMPGGSAELPNFGVLVESTNDEALRDFVHEIQEKENPDDDFVEKEYRETTYEMAEGDPDVGAFTFIEGFMVAGTEEAVKASIDASQDDSLTDSEKFAEATQQLRDDWIGMFYADLAGLLSLFDDELQLSPEEQAIFGIYGFEDQAPSAGIAYVTSESVAFETSGGLAQPGSSASLGTIASFMGPGLLTELPARSWAAFGVADFGKLITGYIEVFADFPGFDEAQIESQFQAETGLDLEEDVLSWMDAAGIFVQGTNLQEIGGGLVVASNDPAKTTETLQAVQRLVSEQGLQPRPVSRDGLDGFSLQAPGMPAPVYLLGGERLVITYGENATDQAISPEEPLAEADAFAAAQDVLGDDFDASFFVDVDAAQSFAESVMGFAGQVDPTYDEDVKPYIDPFAYLIAGARKDGDQFLQKVVIGVP